MQCNECRFHRNATNYKRSNGTCHKHAPAAQVIRDAEAEEAYYRAVWPEVPYNESCGDFESATEQCASPPEEPRASAPPEPHRDVPTPKELLPAASLPSAKEALRTVLDYLETAIEDFEPSAVSVQAQTRSEKGWCVELCYDTNDYTFIVGPDGIAEMT